MDTILDYTIESVAGGHSRRKTVNGNVCMHVGDLTFTCADDFLSFRKTAQEVLSDWFARQE